MNDASARSPDRGRALWPRVLAALVVALAAIAITLALDRTSARRLGAGERTGTLPSLPAVVGTAPAGPPATPGLQAPVGAAQLAAARRAAQAFLAGYLPYLYGRSQAKTLTHLTPGLKAELSRQPPRVTPAQRARRPRLLAIAAVGQSPDTAVVTATIADGAAPPYPIRLLLARRAGTWRVTALPS